MMTIIELFRCFSHVREATGNNDGYRVESIQKWSGGVKGDSWCAWCFVMALDMYFRGFLRVDSPIPRDEKYGSVEEIRALFEAKGWLRDIPHIGDAYFFIRDGRAHHIGMVMDVGVGTFKGAAGNTSEDGESANGTGWFEHDFTIDPETMKFGAYPRPR